MDDLKQMMAHNYLRYASYVILDRAIPDVVDGLKPVQRRILYTLYSMHDGNLHKVANVVGQTMALHPHGDAAITDALVNLANKGSMEEGYFLDRQGNFGNLYTGDPAAASRYIETRLSPLAKETMFNADLTETLPSYDGRNWEPTALPAKIPVLLMQGAEGIAVGMATRILSHNFGELLEAQIAILQKKDYEILPDFSLGGVMDASSYEKGRGKVKLRAKIEVVNEKTLVIREICYGTTTESLIRSIDEAAKKGKIKIDSINDYTASAVEIEIKLPRGQYAQDILPALFAYTDCEVSLNSQVLVIKDGLPWETDVHSILEYQTELLKNYLKRELEIEQKQLEEKKFFRTLERIFIENRLYKKLEELKEYEQVHQTLEKALKKFQKELLRVPTYEDRERLLNIPIRRITRFDIEKNQEEIEKIENRLEQIAKDLKRLTPYTIKFLKDLIKRYGKEFPRRTKISSFNTVDVRALDTREIRVGYDPQKAFVGTSVQSDTYFTCTNFDKILLVYSDGTYTVQNPPEKLYVGKGHGEIVYMGVADKKTEFSVVYKDLETHLCYAKRFIVKQWILDREYRFFEEEMKLEFFSTDSEALLQIQFKPKPKQKVNRIEFSMASVALKGVSAKGVRIAPKTVKKVKLIQKTPSKV